MRGDAVKHTLGTDVLIDVRPMNPLTGPDETEMCPLLRSSLRETPGPGQRNADDAAACKMRDDLVVGDPHVLDAWLSAGHNVDAMPPASLSDGR